jgi:hypothetical protein
MQNLTRGLTPTFCLIIAINLYSEHGMCAQFIFFGFRWNLVFVVTSSKIYAAYSFNLGTEIRVSVFKVSLHVLKWI